MPAGCLINAVFDGECQFPTFVWYQDGQVILGENGSSITADNGVADYSVIVDCDCGGNIPSPPISVTCNDCGDSDQINVTANSCDLQYTFSGGCNITQIEWLNEDGESYAVMDSHTDNNGNTTYLSSTGSIVIDQNGLWSVVITCDDNCTYSETVQVIGCGCDCNIVVDLSGCSASYTITGDGCDGYSVNVFNSEGYDVYNNTLFNQTYHLPRTIPTGSYTFHLISGYDCGYAVETSEVFNLIGCCDCALVSAEDNGNCEIEVETEGAACDQYILSLEHNAIIDFPPGVINPNGRIGGYNSSPLRENVSLFGDIEDGNYTVTLESYYAECSDDTQSVDVDSCSDCDCTISNVGGMNCGIEYYLSGAHCDKSDFTIEIFDENGQSVYGPHDDYAPGHYPLHNDFTEGQYTVVFSSASCNINETYNVASPGCCDCQISTITDDNCTIQVTTSGEDCEYFDIYVDNYELTAGLPLSGANQTQNRTFAEPVPSNGEYIVQLIGGDGCADSEIIQHTVESCPLCDCELQSFVSSDCGYSFILAGEDCAYFTTTVQGPNNYNLNVSFEDGYYLFNGNDITSGGYTISVENSECGNTYSESTTITGCCDCVLSILGENDSTEACDIQFEVTGQDCAYFSLSVNGPGVSDTYGSLIADATYTTTAVPEGGSYIYTLYSPTCAPSTHSYITQNCEVPACDCSLSIIGEDHNDDGECYLEFTTIGSDCSEGFVVSVGWGDRFEDYSGLTDGGIYQYNYVDPSNSVSLSIENPDCTTNQPTVFDRNCEALNSCTSAGGFSGNLSKKEKTV